MDICDDMTGTLKASMSGHQPIVMATQQSNAEICKGLCPTITSSAGMSGNNSPVVLRLTSQCDVKGDEGLKTQSLISDKADSLLALFDNHGKDCRYNGPLKVAPTVAATYGTGGNNIPLLSQPLNDDSYCIAANTIDREPQNGGNGKGFQSNVSYTLTTSDVHAVYKPEPYQEVVGALCHRDYKGVNSIYVNQNKCILDKPYQETVGALCNGDYKGIGNQYVSQGKCIVDNSSVVFGGTGYSNFAEGISTLRASGGTNGGGSENLAVNQNLVRRLTPIECERLQGFPDNWTNINNASDSPRYKALGNSVAIPCVDFVMRGIAYFLQKEKEVIKDGISIS